MSNLFNRFSWGGSGGGGGGGAGRGGHPPRRPIGHGASRPSISFEDDQDYEIADNGNQSQIHWDMVNIQRKDYGGGEIYFDGKLIRKNGVFLPKNLEKLNG